MKLEAVEATLEDRVQIQFDPDEHDHDHDHAHLEGEALERPPLGMRLVVMAAIILPFVGVIAATALLWGWGFNWLYLGLLVVGYALTGLGITVGFHRLFTHSSFETSAPVRFGLGVLGSMAVEGPVLVWVANHRKHHQHSDRDDDPHSPNGYGAGIVALLKGLYHAHVGWLLSYHSPNDVMRYVPDLQKDKVVRVISRLFPLWVALGLLIPAAIAYAVTGTLMGAFLGFVWGGLARIFFVHHITWSVNSVCHLWGARPFKSHDHSRNNVLFGILAFGEGWHNNHHAFPTSARHGLWWWQIDTSYMIIRLMGWLGLARNIRVPSSDRIARKLSH